jgi:hypothetical protein
MRTREEVRRVVQLAEQGLGVNAVARATGIPVATVHRWLAGRLPQFADPEADTCPACGHGEHDFASLDRPAYAYLLGLYLGDGHLASFPRTHCLRIYLDMAYPGIVASCADAMTRVMPRNRVTAIPRGGCMTVQSYSKQWPCFLPQHGPGFKHERSIELAGWQAAITAEHPQELVRGLIHSDGCRFKNPVRRRGRSYSYPRYLFSNTSDDIKAIFCDHLDLQGIAWRRVGECKVSVARREAVARLDEFVGPKR